MRLLRPCPCPQQKVSFPWTWTQISKLVRRTGYIYLFNYWGTQIFFNECQFLESEEGFALEASEHLDIDFQVKEEILEPGDEVGDTVFVEGMKTEDAAEEESMLEVPALNESGLEER